MTQTGEFTGVIQQRTWVILLRLNGQLTLFSIYREVKLRRITGREACSRTRCPLHWRTGTGTFVTTFLAWQVHLILHTDLISVINEWYSWHCQEESHSHFQLIGGVTCTDIRTLIVMIGRWNSYITKILRSIIGFREVINELHYLTFTSLIEVTELIIL